jgi:hypothetical protein
MVPTPSCRSRTRLSRTAKPCGPGAPTLALSSSRRVTHLAGDGDKRARSPGRARSKSSNHRAGKAGCSRLSLWFLPRAFLFARGPRVSVDTRPSLHPLTIWRVLVFKARATLAARTRAHVSLRAEDALGCLTIDADHTRPGFACGYGGQVRLQPDRAGGRPRGTGFEMDTMQRWPVYTIFWARRWRPHLLRLYRLARAT